MNTATSVQRTALSGFTLRGMPVVKGQIVNLNPAELAAASAAGGVKLSADENALVPVSDLPALQPTPASDEARQINARLDELRATARDEATRLEQSIADARAKASADIAEIERNTAERLTGFGREVTEAESRRDAALKAIADQVEAARLAAEIPPVETPPAADAAGRGRGGARQS